MDDHPGDENQVANAARLCRSTAQNEHTGGTSLAAAVKGADWLGPMRDRHATKTGTQQQQWTADAQQLLDIASTLERHAQWIRDEKARLEGLENRIKAWARANPPGSSKTGQDAFLIGSYPSRHKYAWDDLAKRLRSRGVSF
jgi:hypothetical protein